MKIKYIQEWIAKAEQDYQTILILSRQRKKILPDIMCYHAHQCVEKYLKGLLAKHTGKVPKTHNLIFLADELISCEPELESTKDILRNLNRYAVELRYPGESATKQEAKSAVKQIKQIRKILRSKLS